MKTQRRTLVALGLVLVMFFSAPVAYGLGGGGGGGDGRLVFTSSSPQTGSNATNGSGGGAERGTGDMMSSDNRPTAPVTVPEPITALLLGGGVIVVAGLLKRKVN